MNFIVFIVNDFENIFQAPVILSNISNKRDSVSSGYPNTEKRVENKTCSRVFFTKFGVLG